MQSQHGGSGGPGQRRNPKDVYNEFPTSAEENAGDGFNEWLWINDPQLFDASALKADPVLQAFCGVDEDGNPVEDATPIKVFYARFKSSTVEMEYVLHLPVQAMGGDFATLQAKGRVAGIKGLQQRNQPVRPERVQTLIMNHENTLARRITSSLVVVDGPNAAQVVHKEPAAED